MNAQKYFGFKINTMTQEKLKIFFMFEREFGIKIQWDQDQPIFSFIKTKYETNDVAQKILDDTKIRDDLGKGEKIQYVL